MEDQHEQKLVQIAERILDAKEQVSDLADDKNYTVKDVEACHETIRSISADFRAVLAELSEADRDAAERHYGRMVTDLRRHADWLPKLSGGGDSVPLATRDQWTVGVRPPEIDRPREETYLPPRPRPPREVETGPRVGAEIEAWCGPCKRQTTHRIIAMVGTEPKQVVCQSCDARHNFRLTPARGKKSGKGGGKKKEKLTAAQVEQRKREEAQTALQKELIAAKDVRPFHRRARYRAGEIIDHPEHGRGKIENVIRGSILVRFRAGLRPIPTD